MTRDEIIRMARDAGFHVSNYDKSVEGFDVQLVEFAEIIASKEREAGAKVCDDLAMKNEISAQEAESDDDATALRAAAWQISICAAAIRNRK